MARGKRSARAELHMPQLSDGVFTITLFGLWLAGVAWAEWPRTRAKLPPTS